MSGSAPPPAPTHSAHRRPTAGFTMVELLTIVVIIGILASIGLSVAKAISVRQSLTKATGEMDLICTALQSFHRDYGDYPPMDNDTGSGSPYAEQNLLYAISGHARWTTDAAGNPLWEYVPMTKKLDDNSVLPKGEHYTWGKQYLELSKLTIDMDATSESGYKDGAIIHDPWWDGQTGNNAYLYRYKKRIDWTAPANRTWQATTFLLVSRGPDGKPGDAEANFADWKVINKKGAYSGVLNDDYADPGSNPETADNLVRGSTTLP